MPENTPQPVGILDDRDHLHLGAALRADKRINVIDFRQESGPCAFVCIDGDFFISIRQWLVAKVIRDAVALMGGLPPLTRPLGNLWQIFCRDIGGGAMYSARLS